MWWCNWSSCPIGGALFQLVWLEKALLAQVELCAHFRLSRRCNALVQEGFQQMLYDCPFLFIYLFVKLILIEILLLHSHDLINMC